MLPNSIGFMVAAPVAGRLSDKLGSKKLTTAGLSITAISTLALYFLPNDFQLWQLFVITFFSALGMRLFSAPNLADIMASAPPNYRRPPRG
jgi:MFS family permease